MIEENEVRNGFDLYAFMESRNFPEEVVEIYVDEGLGHELYRLQERYEELNERQAYDHSSEELSAIKREMDEIRANIDNVTEEIKKSAVKFHLRGVPVHVINSIHKKYENSKPEDNNTVFELATLMIQKVVSPDGQEDTSNKTVEDIQRLIGIMPQASSTKLLNRVNHMMLSSSAFDSITDAGFLAKS